MDFMNLSSVYMVRSAKGVDMLCVDDYLYHYDGRGRSNTYRWLCNRRKDKHTPCRSRITTILANPRDRTVHIVQEVSGKHTHPRCSDHEITKVSERKRLANLQGEPCTLDLKNKRKSSLPKSIRMAMDSGVRSKRSKLNASSDTSIGQERCNLNKEFDFEDTERVYVLRRMDGRMMCCVDGQLYYLDGKSRNMDLYRWICVRKRDVSCTAVIYTEPTIEGTHRLRSVDSDAHIHPHYSPGKLLHMFDKHNISVLDDDEIEEALESIKGLDLFETVLGLDENVETYEPDAYAYEEDEESIIIEEYVGDDYQVLVDEDENATTEVIVQSIPKKWPRNYDVVEHYVPPHDYDPLTESSLEKFSFLPSAKGKKVLCLNRNLFHFDTQSKANGYLFWTCIMRRNNAVNCHVRVTMDPTENGPVIVRTSGKHNHPMRVDDIRRRLKRQEILNSDYFDDRQVDTNYNSGNEDSDCSSTIDFTNISEHINDFLPTTTTTTDDLQRMVQQRNKVIDFNSIKMEPIIDVSGDNSPIVVEYCDDGSAKINILPLKTEGELTEMDESNTLHSSISHTDSQKSIKKEKKKKKSQSLSPSNLESDMDLTKICKLRSAKGSEMLCVDGYIYHAKNKGLISRSYWVCIKARDPDLNCKSRVSTATQKDGSIRVLRVYNRHSHAVNEADIKRRLFNEINKKTNKTLKFKPLHFIEKSLDQINAEYGDLAIERLKVSNISQDVVVHKPLRTTAPRDKSHTSIDQDDPSVILPTTYQQNQHGYQKELDEQEEQEHDELQVKEATLSIMDISGPLMEDQEEIIVDQEMDEDYAAIETIIPTEEDTIIEEVNEIVEYESVLPVYSMKLYAVSDGPPSLAVRMTLRALQIEYQLINVDFCALEHHSDEYVKMNPQKEIPVLDDDGFILSESIAIMQYLCDKYAPDSTLYPQDATTRAVINQRLCFNMGFYYAPISAHSMAPIFFDYERTPMSLKKVVNALDVFETYLQRTGTKYAASDDLTIADFGLVSATLCLEAIDFDLTQYPLVLNWYNTFKGEFPEFWEIANLGMQEIKEFEKNPPDLSQMNHPFHPTRKASP